MLLGKDELLGKFYTKALNVDDKDVDLYLGRADTYCQGIIGGPPVTLTDGIKIAVALAFEIFTTGESAQVDDETGNITEAAPTGYMAMDYAKKPRYGGVDRMAIVKEMLEPARLEYLAANAPQSDKGVRFI